MEREGSVMAGVVALPTPIPGPVVATCKIVCADAASGYIIINASDFDAATMTLVGAKKSKSGA